MIELRRLRSALGRFCTGVTVVTTARDGQVHAMRFERGIKARDLALGTFIGVAPRALAYTALGDWLWN